MPTMLCARLRLTGRALCTTSSHASRKASVPMLSVPMARHRAMSRSSSRSRISPLDHRLLEISDEVRDALLMGTPVVALESTIYTHGFPYPENVALAQDLEAIVRSNGAVPATIGVVNGVACVGLTTEKLKLLTTAAGDESTMKLSRRDLPYILGMGLNGRRYNGGTTIAGTMLLADLVGISVFGTGGLGGVHRGGQDTMDISADLTELGRTPVAVISSGCKSFLDIPRTLEYLETHGAGVYTFADGRSGAVDYPAFWSRESGVRSPMVVQNEKEAAAIIYANGLFGYGRRSGFHFANPIPAEFSIPREDMEVAIEQAVQEAAEQGIHGHRNTPFILARIKDLTSGNSVAANRALIESNVKVAAGVAVELSKLHHENGRANDTFKQKHDLGSVNYLERDTFFGYTTVYSPRPGTRRVPLSPGQEEGTRSGLGRPLKDDDGDDGFDVTDELDVSETGMSKLAADIEMPEPENISKSDVFVYGSVAIDNSANAVSDDPQMHTSNLASIRSTVGGVGHNVALATHLAGSKTKLVSLVADDYAGNVILSAMKQEGLDIGNVHVLSVNQKEDPIARTAQYMAINNLNRDLMMAMADMSIFTQKLGSGIPFENPHFDTTKLPEWAVVDANWRPGQFLNYIYHLRSYRDSSGSRRIRVAFEPVSVARVTSIMQVKHGLCKHVYPNHMVNLTTPNRYELAAMHDTVRFQGFMADAEWWKVIDACGIPSTGARDRFTAIAGAALTDAGIPVQSVQLLPFIPQILTKLGAQGVLLTELLEHDDARLNDQAHAPYIVSRCANGHKVIGGIYMRLFPAIEQVDDVVSVNGAGDTFLGVLVSGLARGLELDETLINVAQKGAVMTLRSEQAVSPEVKLLAAELDRLCLSIDL